MTDWPKQKSESEWRAILSPEQFRILREKGTERPGTGEYENYKQQGVYSCVGCGTSLYTSSTKFSNGCGWHTFFEGDRYILSPSTLVLSSRYSHPKSSQLTRRYVSVHDPHRSAPPVAAVSVAYSREKDSTRRASDLEVGLRCGQHTGKTLER